VKRRIAKNSSNAAKRCVAKIPGGFKTSSVRRPGGFEIRRKKRFDLLKPGGFVIPQQKERHSPLLRIANPQSRNRLGHFLTPDYKSGGTPSGLAFLIKRGITRNKKQILVIRQINLAT
jgi:hypothetical protein